MTLIVAMFLAMLGAAMAFFGGIYCIVMMVMMGTGLIPMRAPPIWLAALAVATLCFAAPAAILLLFVV